MDEFEELVEQAIESLPDDLRAFMSNVGIVVEDEPPAGLPLLGLYQGVPLTVRTSSYAAVPPDKITIYRGPARAAVRGGDPTACGGRSAARWSSARSRTISGSRTSGCVELDRY